MANETMARAAVAVGSVKTEIREFPLPEIPADAGLLRIAVTGICGSDWGMYKNDKPGPRILGHEMVGTIEKIGDVAKYRWGVKEGDLVALEEYLPCGHCEFCRSGEIRSCLETDQRLPGKIRFGSTPIIVSGLSRDSKRFDLAKALGATHTVEVDKEELGAAVSRITNGRMADIVLDCSGLGPKNINPSLFLLRKRGVLLTVSRGDAAEPLNVNHLINNQLTIRGLRGHSFEAVEMALSVMARKILPLELMSTHRFGLDQIDTALKIVGGQMEEKSIHVSIDPWMS